MSGLKEVKLPVMKSLTYTCSTIYASTQLYRYIHTSINASRNVEFRSCNQNTFLSSRPSIQHDHSKSVTFATCPQNLRKIWSLSVCPEIYEYCFSYPPLQQPAAYPESPLRYCRDWDTASDNFLGVAWNGIARVEEEQV